MSVLSDWEPCQFAEGTPNIHDNFLYAVAAHFDEGHLILHTEYRDGHPREMTDVRFVGLVAYYFQDAASPSILLDITQHSAEEMVKQWGELLESRRNWSWPLDFTDLDDLSRKLAKQGVCGYNLWAAMGLNGFVLAKSAEYRSREKAVEFD
jgi:hypothetical protein